MILSRADLHIHTLYSDGSDSTEQLLTTIRTNQITYFSVTDHDTIDGVMHMQPVLVSYNKNYPDRIVRPGSNFRVFGRVL